MHYHICSLVNISLQRCLVENKVTKQVVWCVMRYSQSKKKSYKRTNVFTNVPKKNYTPSDAFKLLEITVSPLPVKEKYCCSKCTTIVWDYYGTHVDLAEIKTKFLQGVKAESYIATKMVFGDNTDNATFATPRKVLKRLQTLLPSPKKCRSTQHETQPQKVAFRVYCKKSSRRGNKVPFNTKYNW